MKHFSYLSFLLAVSAAQAQAQAPSRPEAAPHIVLIMCDDMGFSDLGCYGSEISTPHLDSLAQAGVRFTEFKNTGRSCPSRASLLTGRYQHTVGMGWMTAVDEHRPGYRGQITDSVPTIAEVMRANGYRTYMSGKWHVTVDEAFDAPNGSYPTQRGFDQYYGCLSGGGSYYTPTPVYRNLTRIKDFPKDYYYTTAITDSATAFIRRHPAGEPMFLYVAHYAPHLPLHAPADRVEKCRPRYECGFDVLRQRRFERQKELGIVPQDAQLPVFPQEFGGKHPAWADLTPEQQAQWTADMATYAAMIEIMDDGIGRLVDALRSRGMLDNTVFIFLSDNGATLEGGYLNQLRADLSNTPYRSYKQWTFNGGISAPFILTRGSDWGKEAGGRISRQTGHIIDILPTCLDLVSAHYTGAADELPGISLLPFAEDETKLADRTLFFEHQSSCAVIDGHWKLVRADRRSPWELHDLSTDPYELHDLSAIHPDKAKELEEKWTDWAKESEVFPLEDLPWGERIRYYKEKKNTEDL